MFSLFAADAENCPSVYCSYEEVNTKQFHLAF